MKIKLLIISTISIAALLGCSIQKGFILPAVQVNGPNFRIVKSIRGEAEATYVLGIGGLNREGLVNEAKRDMYERYQLARNQIISNITLDEKISFFLIVIIKKIILSADIIQFGDDPIGGVQSDNNSKSEVNKKEENQFSGLSKDEEIIARLNGSQNIKTVEYYNVNEVKIDDFVMFKTIFNEKVYGKVEEIISSRKVKIKLFPAPGATTHDVMKFSELQKVVF